MLAVDAVFTAPASRHQMGRPDHQDDPAAFIRGEAQPEPSLVARRVTRASAVKSTTSVSSAG